ncbi:MAG: beta-lactamase family protein [Deltaproteobacteria bacterium]|nr:beta-lactamase family protein [Deltaproteobacteria bacterium]
MRQPRSKPTALLLGAISIAGWLGCSGCSDDDADDPLLDDTPVLQAALDSLAQSEVDDMSILGMGISVRLADGRVLHASAGHSDPEGSPYDVASTKQVIGSVTKVYTAVMVMQLVESGLVSLDDTIDGWIAIPRADEITVRMLLNHTSGLADHEMLMSEDDYSVAWSPRELVQIAVDAGQVANPGENVARYSNTNYVVLGLIVEAVTGRSWQQNLAERISAPLGLEHTFYAGDPEGAEGLAGGWIHTQDGWISSLTRLDPSFGWATGSMVATNEEVTAFARAFFAGELFDSPETLERMLSFDVPMAPEFLGGQPPTTLGLCVMRVDADGVALVGHLGHAPGYATAMLRDPETGALIVVTSNTQGALPGWTVLKIAQFLRAR